MALDKKLLAVGSKITVIGLKAKTAGIIVGDRTDTIPGIAIRDPHATQNTIVQASVGDTLTVVKLPRKIFGVNFCRVATADGLEGEVFWTELRSNCKVV